MLKPVDPEEAYRKVAFDARVAGSSGPDLVRLCLDEVEAALSRALWADARSLVDMRREALARAQAGISALSLGVDKGSSLGPALLTLYGAMASTVTASRFRFDAAAIGRVRADLAEIRQAMFA